jgi:hypothetical protein
VLATPLLMSHIWYLERCLDSNPESCRSNSTYSASTGRISVHTLTQRCQSIKTSECLCKFARGPKFGGNVICMVLGLLRCLKNTIASASVPDPNPDPTLILKNLDSYCFVTSFRLYGISLKNDGNVPL